MEVLVEMWGNGQGKRSWSCLGEGGVDASEISCGNSLMSCTGVTALLELPNGISLAHFPSGDYFMLSWECSVEILACRRLGAFSWEEMPW
jgi:hypothetical protein